MKITIISSDFLNEKIDYFSSTVYCPRSSEFNKSFGE